MLFLFILVFSTAFAAENAPLGKSAPGGHVKTPNKPLIQFNSPEYIDPGAMKVGEEAPLPKSKTKNTSEENPVVKVDGNNIKRETSNPNSKDPSITVNYNEDAPKNNTRNGTLQVMLLDPSKNPVVVKGVCTDGKLSKSNTPALTGESCEALNNLAKTPGSPPVRGYSNDAEKQTRKPPGGGLSAAEGGKNC